MRSMKKVFTILLFCHVIQPSRSWTRLRDQCFFCLCTHCCRASLLVRLWYHCSQWWFLGQCWVFPIVLCHYKQIVIQPAHASFPVLFCFKYACILFIISWWDIHDHRSSGALPVGGRAQRSLRKWALNMTTKNSWMWNREDLSTIRRTVTHHPSSLVPSRVQELSWEGETVASVHAYSSSSTRVVVLSGLTGPAWDACDELEPEEVATADGLNMILDTLAEAFQCEYDVDGSHTAYASQAIEALVDLE